MRKGVWKPECRRPLCWQRVAYVRRCKQLCVHFVRKHNNNIILLSILRSVNVTHRRFEEAIQARSGRALRLRIFLIAVVGGRNSPSALFLS